MTLKTLRMAVCKSLTFNAMVWYAVPLSPTFFGINAFSLVLSCFFIFFCSQVFCFFYFSSLKSAAFSSFVQNMRSSCHGSFPQFSALMRSPVFSRIFSYSSGFFFFSTALRTSTTILKTEFPADGENALFSMCAFFSAVTIILENAKTNVPPHPHFNCEFSGPQEQGQC